MLSDRMRRIRLPALSAPCIVAVIAAAACSDPPTRVSDAFTGHFIGPAWVAVEPEGYYLALSLRPSAGTAVTGTGWLTGISYPAIPLRISGNHDRDNLDLDLEYTDGSIFGSFTGATTQTRITGEWTWQGNSLPVQLSRVDTNATATYQATLTGSFAETHEGSAGFTFYRDPVINRTVLTLAWFETSDPFFVVEWDGPPKPAGVYSLTPSATLDAVVYPTGERGYRWTVISGTLTIDLSTEYAMIGRISAVATEDVGARTLTLNGQFSAGCAGLPCRQ
jgi:hypothetical protein